jgi:hypothetical protein
MCRERVNQGLWIFPPAVDCMGREIPMARKRKVSDDEIATALRQTNGNQTMAAGIVGISRRGLAHRIKQNPSLQALASTQPGRRRQVTDEQILKALTATDAYRPKALKRLGLTDSQLGNRILGSAELKQFCCQLTAAKAARKPKRAKQPDPPQAAMGETRLYGHEEQPDVTWDYPEEPEPQPEAPVPHVTFSLLPQSFWLALNEALDQVTAEYLINAFPALVLEQAEYRMKLAQEQYRKTWTEDRLDRERKRIQDIEDLIKGKVDAMARDVEKVRVWTAERLQAEADRLEKMLARGR